MVSKCTFVLFLEGFRKKFDRRINSNIYLSCVVNCTFNDRNQVYVTRKEYYYAKNRFSANSGIS